MKKAVILIHHGTSYEKAAEKSLLPINEALTAALSSRPEYKVFPCCGNLNVLPKISEEHRPDSIRSAVEKSLAENPEEILFTSTFMISGEVWQSSLEQISKVLKDTDIPYRIQPPILDPDNEESAAELADALENTFHFQPRQHYLLIGHGGTKENNDQFYRLAEAFKEDGRRNVHVAVMSDYQRISAIGARIRMEEGVRLVIFIPLFITAGGHAIHQIGGKSPDGKPTIIQQFESRGCNVRYECKGLGEYPRFRKALIQHMIGFIL